MIVIQFASTTRWETDNKRMLARDSLNPSAYGGEEGRAVSRTSHAKLDYDVIVFDLYCLLFKPLIFNEKKKVDNTY